MTLAERNDEERWPPAGWSFAEQLRREARGQAVDYPPERWGCNYAPHEPCGTPAAYQRHLRHGETPDEACAAAKGEYNRRHRRRSPETPVTMRDFVR